MVMKLTLLFFLCVSAINLVWSRDTLVTIQQGTVRGSWVSAGRYTEYLGIPYATIDPENPFGDAIFAPKFDGTLRANNDWSVCPHRDEFNLTLVGSLDCLHVSVFVPESASSNTKLSVMAHIIGGGFILGYPGQYIYGPQYLIRHDVILVSVNYRLGPYGFTCLNSSSIPGNTGLKDQQLALRWIQENIEAFYGNKDNVTIFGNSAGGISVELHMFASGSKGLFAKGIIQSGSSIISTVFKDSASALVDIASYFGFTVENDDDALHILKHIEPFEIIKAAENIGIQFLPCIEKAFEKVHNFLTKSPHDIILSGEYYTVPLLLGNTNNESTGIEMVNSQLDDSYIEGQQNRIYKDLSTSFSFNSPEQLEKAVRIVSDFYLANKVITDDNFQDLIDYIGDAEFVYPTERSILKHISNSNHAIYKYIFAYDGNLNFWKLLHNLTNIEGAIHADEIGYLFKLSYVPNENITPKDQLIIDRLTTMWTNFAKFGDPTPEITDLLPVRWKAMTEEAHHYLWIDTEMHLDQQAFHKRMSFWNMFYEAYGEYENVISCIKDDVVPAHRSEL